MEELTNGTEGGSCETPDPVRGLPAELRTLAGLDDAAEDDPAEVERAWQHEVERRMAEVDAGTAELIPAEEVFAELRARDRNTRQGQRSLFDPPSATHADPMHYVLEPIRLIRDVQALDGTCYFEFLPGDFQGVCWNPHSVYLTEEVFGYLEPVVERHVRDFDHYSFVGVSVTQWNEILEDFDRLVIRLETASSVAELDGAVGFLFVGTQAAFEAEFRSNSAALAQLVSEFSGWLRDELQRHPSVSILGM